MSNARHMEKMTIDILLVEDNVYSISCKLLNCMQQLKKEYELGKLYQAGNLNLALEQIRRVRTIGVVFCDTEFNGIVTGADIGKAIHKAYGDISIVGFSADLAHKPLWEFYDFVLKREFNADYLKGILIKHK
jgi:hypothetical protein